MKYLFVEYPKCTTCQKAKKWLVENEIAFEDRHIVNDTPTADELKRWLELSGLPVKKFFNTSGLLYKSMNLKDKLDEMTLDEKLELLSGNGMLIKRPLVVGENLVLLGFNEEKWEILK